MWVGKIVGGVPIPLTAKMLPPASRVLTCFSWNILIFLLQIAKRRLKLLVECIHMKV